MQESNLKSPLKKVDYLGSAHNGTSHFWHQRLSAVILIVLSIWFIYALLTQLPADYYQVVKWFKQPLNTVSLLTLLIVMMYHTQLGFQAIIDDYVHSHLMRFITTTSLKLLSLLVMISSVIILIHIHAIQIPVVHNLTTTGQF